MKILFIAPLPMPVTGQSLACQLFYSSLLDDGHAVKVINLSKGNLKNGASSVQRVLEIAKILMQVAIKRRHCDLVYFNTSESVAGNLKDLLIFVLLAGKLESTYTHLHGGAGMRELLSSKYPLLRSLNAFFLRRIAGVIVLGERHTEMYKGLTAPSQIHIVENFAPDDLFINDKLLEEKFSHEVSVRVLFLSNLLPGKGYKELVSAIQLLDPDVKSQLIFDFAGGFESEDDKDEFVGSIDGLSNVTYHGSVHGRKKTELLEQANIFCLPTYYPFEGQPISILEAYAAGCTVITTDHSGIFDIFTPEVNGKAVEKKSSHSIAAALETLVKNRALLRKFGTANAQEARGKYRPHHHLARLKQCLALVVA